jgi:hypothetical protein
VWGGERMGAMKFGGGFDCFSVGLLMWKDAGKAMFGALGRSSNPAKPDQCTCVLQVS